MKIAAGGLVLSLIVTNVLLTPRQVARKINSFLHARLPDVQELQVEVRGARGVPALKGNFHALTIHGRSSDVTPLATELLEAMPETYPSRGVGRTRAVTLSAHQFVYDNVEVEQADAQFQNLTYNVWDMLKRRRVSRLAFERGVAVVSLTPDSATKVAVSILEKKGFTDLTVRWGDGYAEVTGKRRLVVADVSFHATGKIVGKGNEFHVMDVEAKTGRLPLPAPLVKVLVKELNPLFVFDAERKYPFDINVRRVTITPERVTAEAELVYKRVDG